MGGIEQFWKVFDHYPDTIHKLNHPYMDIIFQGCIPKEQIIYVRHDSQTYSLQLSGYDGELHTLDDLFHEPVYGQDSPGMWYDHSRYNQG